MHGPDTYTEMVFPKRDESGLFERLLLEINQAGLGWETILRKRDGFRHAYDGFDVGRVADYGDRDRTRLLAEAGIIRNRLKVDAAIHNAGVIRGLRDSHGGFAEWLDAHAGEDGRQRGTASWVQLSQRHLKFSRGPTPPRVLIRPADLPR